MTEMGLRDELTADMAEAFDTDLADAVESFAGERLEAGGFDPVTGMGNPSTTTYTGRGVFGAYRLDQIDGTLILATDKELMALQAEVTDTPQVNDTINGLRAVRVEQDPAGATWTIQLRG